MPGSISSPPAAGGTGARCGRFAWAAISVPIRARRGSASEKTTGRSARGRRLPRCSPTDGRGPAGRSARSARSPRPFTPGAASARRASRRRGISTGFRCSSPSRARTRAWRRRGSPSAATTRSGASAPGASSSSTCAITSRTPSSDSPGPACSSSATTCPCEMSIPRPRAVWIALGALTAAQLGIGAWRAGVMLHEGIAAGVQPFVLSGVAAEVALSVVLAALAWWWLPARGGGGRSLSAWGVRFVLLAWTLALAHYGFALLAGKFTSLLTPIVLVSLAVLGVWVRRSPAAPAPAAASPTPDTWHPVLWLAAAFWLYQLAHLAFPYHFTDAHDIWACRALKFAEHGALTGVFDCLDPARPPLYSVMLWLGVGDPTFQGRLLPTLLVGAFGVVFYHLVRRVAPRLAPWGVLWLFVTDHVMKGAVSFYAGVPVVVVACVAVARWGADGTLLPGPTAV